MTISELKAEKKKKYIYCAGHAGVIVYNFFRMLDIDIESFIDNNINKNGIKIVDDIICNLPDLIDDKENCIVFVAISRTNYNQIEATASLQGFINLYNINDIFDEIIKTENYLYYDFIRKFSEYPVAEIFFKRHKPIEKKYDDYETNKRIAVYTSVFGKYDLINDPLVIHDNVDYYYVSDDKCEGVNVYKWIDAKKYVPDDVETAIKRNRYVKMHPHKIFPDYDYSIYLDANIKIIGDIRTFVKESVTGIAAFNHPFRDCLYYEALTITNFRRVDSEDVVRQMSRYINEKMPLHYGLPEMAVIARTHNKKCCIKIMEEWWNEFNIGAQRDQLSFMYIIWKNEFSLDDIALLGDDFRTSDVISVSKHIAESKMIKNNI